MNKKQYNAMVARKKAEKLAEENAEIDTVISNDDVDEFVEESPENLPEDWDDSVENSVSNDDSDENNDDNEGEVEEYDENEEELGVEAGVFNNVDFNIDNCLDKESITKKLLYFADQEREILKQFKDESPIMDDKVYEYLYNSVVNVFGNYQSILRQRLQLKIEEAKLTVGIEQLQFRISKLKRDKINNKFEVRRLRYANRLYNKKKWREYFIERKAMRDKANAELAALRAMQKNNAASVKKTKIEAAEQKDLPP